MSRKVREEKGLQEMQCNSALRRSLDSSSFLPY